MPAIGRRVLGMMIRRRHRPGSERALYSERELAVIVRNRGIHESKQAREAERRAARDAAKAARRSERATEWHRHRAARAAQDAEKKAMGRAR
jgi:hypothetical protein